MYIVLLINYIRTHTKLQSKHTYQDRNNHRWLLEAAVGFLQQTSPRTPL